MILVMNLLKSIKGRKPKAWSRRDLRKRDPILNKSRELKEMERKKKNDEREKSVIIGIAHRQLRKKLETDYEFQVNLRDINYMPRYSSSAAYH